MKNKRFAILAIAALMVIGLLFGLGPAYEGDSADERTFSYNQPVEGADTLHFKGPAETVAGKYLRVNATEDAIEFVEGTGAGAPTDAKYIVGLANGSLSAEKVKAQLYNNYDIDDTPASPNAMDDEFDDSSLDEKWTLVNDPGISETTYTGYVYTVLSELGTDNFDNLIRMYQTPPTGTAVMDFIIKATIAITGEAVEDGEFASIGVYLGNSANDELWSSTFQINNILNANYVGRAIAQKSTAGTFANSTTTNPQVVPPTALVYLKLSKTTANAYTSANTYIAYYSLNGLIWHEVGTESFTFTTACNELGIFFRKPKTQSGTPAGTSILDFFRRID